MNINYISQADLLKVQVRVHNCINKVWRFIKQYSRSESPLFSNMISPIRAISTASKEKKMILAHQWPPVPCSWWECMNTSPSPKLAAVPRGSSTPNSSENNNLVWKLQKLHITNVIKEGNELLGLPFFFFLSLRFLGCTSPDMVHVLALRKRQIPYCFITLGKQRKQWTCNKRRTRAKQESKCAIIMNKETCGARWNFKITYITKYLLLSWIYFRINLKITGKDSWETGTRYGGNLMKFWNFIIAYFAFGNGK